MDAKDKIADDTNSSARFEQGNRERAEDALHGQIDMTNQEALKEAARLGGGDTYLVKTDLEDQDQREGADNEDGSVSSLANADNPER